jgi:hypothetical protein
MWCITSSIVQSVGSDGSLWGVGGFVSDVVELAEKKNENWGRGFFTWCYTSDKYIWYETPCEIHAFQITWHYFDVTMQKKFRHNVKTLQKPFPVSLLQALDRWSLQTMNYCINNFKLLFQFNICDIKLKCVL